MNKIPKPFDCEYSPQFAELLHKLGISLAISTYQVGKVIFLSAVDSDKLTQLPRTYKNAMGMAVSKNRLAISSLDEVTVLRNIPDLAHSYPNKPGVYDGIYVPRASYNTGYLALHDMDFVDNKLIAVNTMFSCLSYIDDKDSFTPFWQPPFISAIAPEDRCHLNGLAIENNEIKYITALGNTDTLQGWREEKMNGGVLMEYPSGKIVLDGLSMPHSPRIYDGKLYVLNSALGELICVDPLKGTYEVIVKLGGFARGMSRYGDYLFIGVSKLRHNSKEFSDLDIAKTSFAGVIAVYLPYKSIVGSFKYEMSVDEIYDVKVLENTVRPSLLSADMPVHRLAISTPQGSFWSNTVDDNKKQQTGEVPIGEKSNHYKFQLHKNISNADLIKHYSTLLIHDTLDKLRKNKLSGFLAALVTYTGNLAVALTVFEVTKEGHAIIHSVFVQPDLRNQGIAKNMLKQIKRIFSENNITHADINYDNNADNADIIEKLFNDATIFNLKETQIQNKE